MTDETRLPGTKNMHTQITHVFVMIKIGNWSVIVLRSV